MFSACTGNASSASLLGLSARLNPVARLVAAKALFWGAPGAGRGRVDAQVEKHMACKGPSFYLMFGVEKWGDET